MHGILNTNINHIYKTTLSQCRNKAERFTMNKVFWTLFLRVETCLNLSCCLNLQLLFVGLSTRFDDVEMKSTIYCFSTSLLNFERRSYEQIWMSNSDRRLRSIYENANLTVRYSLDFTQLLLALRERLMASSPAMNAGKICVPRY